MEGWHSSRAAEYAAEAWLHACIQAPHGRVLNSVDCHPQNNTRKQYCNPQAKKCSFAIATEHKVLALGIFVDCGLLMPMPLPFPVESGPACHSLP
jgi:hypothetical protein